MDQQKGKSLCCLYEIIAVVDRGMDRQDEKKENRKTDRGQDDTRDTVRVKGLHEWNMKVGVDE